jgi:hypothetical protein
MLAVLSKEVKKRVTREKTQKGSIGYKMHISSHILVVLMLKLKFNQTDNQAFS